MWVVYDSMEGLVCVTDDYNKALEEYEHYKESYKDYVRDNGEYSGDEQVILAEVKKNFFSYDTKEPVIEYDDDGNEVDTGDTYWNWKEQEFK
jgi:hypothetical protein